MSKLISVTENYKIQVDNHNCTLVQYMPPSVIPVGEKKGQLSEPKWKPIDCYLPSVGMAVNEIIRRESISKDDELTLAQYVDQITELQNQVLTNLQASPVS